MHVDRLEADILCVGGGIAGLMAAIRAGELGAKVIVAEKSNTLHSGSGGLGNDHFLCYIPEVHGGDIKPVIEAVQRSLTGAMRHRELLRAWLENTFEIIKLWDAWGIPMKYQGRWEFAGHAFPGEPLVHLHYSGQYQKTVLTREARKRNVEIVNRLMAFDLLTQNDSIVGAIGLDTRDKRVVEIRAKAVVLATGRCVRLFPSPIPGLMFNVAYSPCSTGDGKAMAYRAGVGLANIEMPRRWAGPRYFARCGKGTWIGVLRDPQGNPIGPFVSQPDKRYGDPISDAYPGVFEDYAKSGKGPVYMDCNGLSAEDFEYMLHFLKQEGLTSFLNYLEEEGIDPRRNPVEFGTYEILPRGGIYHDDSGETSVKGLFTAGDEAYSSSSISMAATLGWLIGETMAKRVRETDFSTPKTDPSLVGEKVALLDEISNRKTGADWKEVNLALQQVMQDYAGMVRSETLLQAGLSHLQRLKAKAYSTMRARNQHELMHCVEVLDLLDVGEAVFIAANERKETRGTHIRTDYRFTNPLLEKFLIVRKKDGKPVIEWQAVRR